MAGYTKDFLVNAFVSRYAEFTKDFDAYYSWVSNFYDEVGREKFRVYCSLDAEALRKYRLEFAT
jgi:hypothetical protein